MIKGYAIAYQDEKVVDSVDNIKKDLPFIVRLKDGKVITRIEEIQKSEE
jgi:exonuclease VII large subunit